MWFLYRSRAGLVLRAVGESPESAHALGYPVRRIRLAAVLAGGALCGLAGAYISVIYTPLWVEGMVAGKGWIALALTTFATWRPARVLARRLSVRRRHHAAVPPAGQGVDVPSQFLTHAAVCGDHRRAGADLAQSGLDPRQHAGLAWQAVLSRTHNRRTSRPTTPGEATSHDRLEETLDAATGALSPLRVAAPGWLQQERSARAGPGARACARPGAGPAEPLKIAFAYVGPVGDGGWTFAHDNGAQGGGEGVRRQGRDHASSRSVPEAADAERVLRDMVAQGNKLIFGTTFGYMEPMLKVAADTKDVKFEHATGYKTRREPAHLRQPHLRRRVHGRRDRRQDDQDQHAGRGRRRSRFPR